LTPAIACVGSGRGGYKEQASESGAAAYDFTKLNLQLKNRL